MFRPKRDIKLYVLSQNFICRAYSGISNNFGRYFFQPLVKISKNMQKKKNWDSHTAEELINAGKFDKLGGMHFFISWKMRKIFSCPKNVNTYEKFLKFFCKIEERKIFYKILIQYWNFVMKNWSRDLKKSKCPT